MKSKLPILCLVGLIAFCHLQSIEDDDVEPDKEHFDAQRRRYEIKAHTEAPKIAARFSSIYADLVQMGITVRHSPPSLFLGDTSISSIF
jgi:hypothetical protein